MLGSLVSLCHIGYILSSDQSKEDKVANITGALGGLAGATGGSILGGLLGTLGLPFIGTAVGGGLGGILGYFAGEYITKALAQYLLDMPITAFPDWTGLNDMMNGEVKTGSGGGTAIQSGGGAGEFDVGSTSPQNTRASNPPSAMSIANAYNQANSEVVLERVMWMHQIMFLIILTHPQIKVLLCHSLDQQIHTLTCI